MFLVLTSYAYACKTEYRTTENVIVEDVIENIGLNADCNITLYNNNTLLSNDIMLRQGLAYNFDYGILNRSAYVSNIQCNLSNSSFLGQCNFVVQEGGDTMYIALGIIMIGIITFILFVSLFTDSLNLKNMEEVPIPFFKYTLWVIAGWLTLPMINVMMVGIDIQGITLTATIDTFYKAIMVLMIIFSMGLLIWFLYTVLYQLSTLGKEAKFD